jgi:hypothetical protein
MLSLRIDDSRLIALSVFTTKMADDEVGFSALYAEIVYFVSQIVFQSPCFQLQVPLSTCSFLLCSIAAIFKTDGVSLQTSIQKTPIFCTRNAISRVI